MMIAVLVLLFAALQYVLWFDKGGLLHARQLQNRVNVQTEENEKLKQRNEKVKAEIEDLKTGMDAIEEHARAELGMIKKGEVYYQMTEEPNDPPAKHD